MFVHTYFVHDVIINPRLPDGLVVLQLVHIMYTHVML